MSPGPNGFPGTLVAADWNCSLPSRDAAGVPTCVGAALRPAPHGHQTGTGALLMARLCGRCAHLYTCTHLYVNSWHRSTAERGAGWNILGRLVVRDGMGGFKVTLSAKGAWGHGALPHTARKPSRDLQQTGREAGAPSQAVGRQTAVCSDNPGSQTVTPHRSPPDGQDPVNN